MQELIYWLDINMVNEPNQKHLEGAKNLATYLLKKEKQQIIDAVESGGIMISGEGYYNETFSKKTQK